MESFKEQESNEILDTTRKAIVFTLNNKKDLLAEGLPTEEEYAIDITKISEVISYSTPSRLPGKPAYIMGVINIRAEVICLFDLPHRLNHNIDYETSKIIIVMKNGEKIGLITQSVKDVITFKDSEIERVSSGNIDFVTGLIKKEEVITNEDGTTTKKTKVITLLDTDQIIKEEDTKFELVD